MTIDAGIDAMDGRLIEVLRSAMSLPELTYSREPVQLTGGFWAELLAFSLADPPPGWPADMVARLMPDSGLARKETIVQAAVAAAGYPTPAIRVSGGPGEGLGRAYMVMDRAAGTPLMPGLNGVTDAAAGMRQALAIPEVLASATAGLHALDPQPVRDQLGSVRDVPVTLPGMLETLADMAARSQREDLVRAARWLLDNPRPPAPAVICHGDLHPFNILVSGRQITVLDWSACLLAPRAYDIAFTTSMLSEPPIRLSSPLRQLLRAAGRLLARRFVRRYEAHAAVSVGHDELRWHQAVIGLRALTEVAGWVHDGLIGERADHPWLANGSALAVRLSEVTGVAVRPQ